MSPPAALRIIETIADIPAAQWNALAGSNPFLSHAYLSGMSHDKRKRIKQERRKVREAGIAFDRVRGENITPAQWDFFVRCYAHTHRHYHSPQPLNLDFSCASARPCRKHPARHRLARGFLPVTTWSAHWLAHPEFARAVEDFLQRESSSINQYVDELNDSNPFKQLPEKSPL